VAAAAAGVAASWEGGAGVLARVDVALITHVVAGGGTHDPQSQALGPLVDAACAASEYPLASGAARASPAAVVAGAAAAAAAASAGGGGGSPASEPRGAGGGRAGPVPRRGGATAGGGAPPPHVVMPVNPLSGAPPRLLRVLLAAFIYPSMPKID